MALALYRKYRPRTFAEVIGQDHVTQPLMQALRSGRLNHAYLFSGPRGCGKTSSARILARSLNCERGPTPEPCGECDSCVALAPDGPGSIDVIEIDAASHGGVDDARDLRERAVFAPVSSRFKVYIIDEAHMVSSAGFNALLKLVEEPPDYVKFVFATTEPEKVLGTIKSRTHHYPFRLIPPAAMRPYLEQLCDREGMKVDPAVFPLVVRAGGGSARDSLSVLDQLISGSGEAGVSYAGAVALLGVTDAALINEMCDALAAGDGATAFATIDRVAEAGHDSRRFAADLLERLRDLIVLQQVPDAAGKGLIDAPADELGRMALQAERFGQATLSRLADIVHTGLTEMRGTTAPRLLLELICARMLLPGTDDTGALLQRMERMERRLTAAGEVPPDGSVSAPPAAHAPAAHAPAAPPAAGARAAGPPPANGTSRAAAPPARESGQPGRDRTPAQHAPADQDSAGDPEPHRVPAGGDPEPHPEAPRADTRQEDPAATSGVIDAAAVRRRWEEITGYVRRKSPRVAAVLREANVRDVDGDTLVLLFKHSVHATMLSGSPQALIEAVYEVLGSTWRIRCEVAGQPGGGQATAAPTPRSGSAPGAANAQPPRAARPEATRSNGGAAAAADDGDWPTTARPGGIDAAAAESPAPNGRGQAPGGHPQGTNGQPTNGQGVRNQGPNSQGINGQPPAARAPMGTGHQSGAASESGVAAARSAARGAGNSRPGGRPAGGARPGRGTGASSGADAGWDAPPPDEPPYDPDYDPPIRDGRAVEGFDPGDEPGDEIVDDQTVRQTSEQQALALLQQQLGAEKINDADAR